MSVDLAIVQSLGLVAGGILVILAIGLVCLRSGTVTMATVAAFAVGAFLVAAPLLAKANLGKDGIIFETIAGVKQTSEIADTNTTLIRNLQSVVEDLKNQVNTLAEQQKKLLASNTGANPNLSFDLNALNKITAQQTDLQSSLQKNADLLRQIQPKAEVNAKAIQDLARQLNIR
jgi:hypothetical protein